MPIEARTQLCASQIGFLAWAMLCLTSCFTHTCTIDTIKQWVGSLGAHHPHYFKFSIEKLPPLPIGEGITGLGSRQLNHIADWKVACSTSLTRLPWVGGNKSTKHLPNLNRLYLHALTLDDTSSPYNRHTNLLSWLYDLCIRSLCYPIISTMHCLDTCKATWNIWINKLFLLSCMQKVIKLFLYIKCSWYSIFERSSWTSLWKAIWICPVWW